MIALDSITTNSSFSTTQTESISEEGFPDFSSLEELMRVIEQSEIDYKEAKIAFDRYFQELQEMEGLTTEEKYTLEVFGHALYLMMLFEKDGPADEQIAVFYQLDRMIQENNYSPLDFFRSGMEDPEALVIRGLVYKANHDDRGDEMIVQSAKEGEFFAIAILKAMGKEVPPVSFELSPESYDYRKAHIHFLNQEYPQAIAILDEMEDSWEAKSLQGYCYLMNGEIDKAVQNFSALIEEGEDIDEVEYGYMLATHLQGKMEMPDSYDSSIKMVAALIASQI